MFKFFERFFREFIQFPIFNIFFNLFIPSFGIECLKPGSKMFQIPLRKFCYCLFYFFYGCHIGFSRFILTQLSIVRFLLKI
jgi:hypothetical protein